MKDSLARWTAAAVRRAARPKADFHAALMGDGLMRYCALRLRGYALGNAVRFAAEVLQFFVWPRVFAIKFLPGSLACLAVFELLQAGLDGAAESARLAVRDARDDNEARQALASVLRDGLLLGVGGLILGLGAWSQWPVLGALALAYAPNAVATAAAAGVTAKARLARPFTWSLGLEALPTVATLAAWPFVGDQAFPAALLVAGWVRAAVTLVAASRTARALGFDQHRPSLRQVLRAPVSSLMMATVALAHAARRGGTTLTLAVALLDPYGVLPIVARILSPLLNAAGGLAMPFALDLQRRLPRAAWPAATRLLRAIFATCMLGAVAAWGVAVATLRWGFPPSLKSLEGILLPLFLAKGLVGFGCLVGLSQRRYGVVGVTTLVLGAAVLGISIILPDLPRLALATGALGLLGVLLASPAMGSPERLVRRNAAPDRGGIAFALALRGAGFGVRLVFSRERGSGASLAVAADRSHLEGLPAWSDGRSADLWIAGIDPPAAVTLAGDAVGHLERVDHIAGATVSSVADAARLVGVLCCTDTSRRAFWAEAATVPGALHWRAGSVLCDQQGRADGRADVRSLMGRQLLAACEGVRRRLRPGSGYEAVVLFEDSRGILAVKEAVFLPITAPAAQRARLQRAASALR